MPINYKARNLVQNQDCLNVCSSSSSSSKACITKYDRMQVTFVLAYLRYLISLYNRGCNSAETLAKRCQDMLVQCDRYTCSCNLALWLPIEHWTNVLGEATRQGCSHIISHYTIIYHELKKHLQAS